MNFKKMFTAGLACFGLAAVDSFAELSTDDYVEAAWMTTRFFGAQRSGAGPNWMAEGTTYTTSFLQDKYISEDKSISIDVSGGWFDCGDHVMFGQTQGVASYMLALAYAEFTEGFYDLYTGDYSDYKASKDYSRAGGKPNKVRDLLEELHYEADFWVKAAIDENTFVTVKGNGDKDHNKWVTPGKMSTLGTDDGGDPREITATANDSYTPGMAAAMLAVMARVEPVAEKQTAYLKAAKTAYAYSKSHSGVTTSGGYYQEGWWSGRTDDGKFLAALELYRTTKDDSYKTEAQTYFNSLKFESGSYTRLAYANAVPLSVVMGEGVFGWKPKFDNAPNAKSYLDNIYANQNQNGIFTKETGGGGSFSVRTPSGGAFLYALYSKFNNSSSLDASIEKNIAYLLGDNENKKSYVAGFDRNKAKAPTAVHHRGYYANEDESKDPDSGLQPPEKNKYFGAMIAGSFQNVGHNSTVSSWNENEVCVDINAPLVGALGYILSKRAPKTDDELGVEVPSEVKDDDTGSSSSGINPDGSKKDQTALKGSAIASSFSMSQNGMNMSITNSRGESFKVQVFDMQGNKLQEISSQSGSTSFVLKSKGMLLLKVSSESQKQIYTVKAL